MAVRICKAMPDEVSSLMDMSKAAFDTDIFVRNPEVGGPPNYDDEPWHRQMLEAGHLFSIHDGDTLVGGMLLFADIQNPQILYIGRIFWIPSSSVRVLAWPPCGLWKPCTPMLPASGWIRRCGICAPATFMRSSGTKRYPGMQSLCSLRR